MELIFSGLIAVFTAILAWATFKLAKHTKSLADLTRRLVGIEEKRDQNEKLQNRISDLRSAVQSAENIQKIFPQHFTEQLSAIDRYPEDDIKAFESLYSLRSYINNDHVTLCLHDLCDIFDSVRDQKIVIRFNKETVIKDIQDIQRMLLSFIKGWRTELGHAP